MARSDDRVLVVLETSNGRGVAPLSPQDAERHLEEARLARRASSGWPVSYEGGHIELPDGSTYGGWGEWRPRSEPPLFEALHHLTTDGLGVWLPCRDCGRIVCKSQLMSVFTRRCSRCAYASDPYERPLKFTEGPDIPPLDVCPECKRARRRKQGVVLLDGSAWLCKEHFAEVRQQQVRALDVLARQQRETA